MMPRLRSVAAGAALLVLTLATAGAQAPVPVDPVLPATGLDFSGIDEFWRVVDLLGRRAEPTQAQWDVLLSTPGYWLAQRSIGRTVRQDLELAFNPSRRAEFDSLTGITDDRASRLRHLVRAVSRRGELQALRDTLAHGLPTADALRLAQRFLPPGATALGEPPLVAFAIFRDDAYAQPQGIVVDLMNVLENGLNPMLAHEFHHTYLRRATNPPPVRDGAADGALAAALSALRNEGVADLVDKPYPLAATVPSRAPYVARYNDEYTRTPATLRAVDSLLVLAAVDSTRLPIIGRQVRTLLWSSGHPNGAYIARTIYETFGVDSLLPGLYNPGAFLRAYTAAERKRGNPTPFSPMALVVLGRLEQRHWMR
jgi:Putative zinc dependent peptidase (DUF5700)